MQTDDRGQSLIEIAVSVPLLLLILIGIVDVGRVFHDSIALSTGAREGAALAARLSQPDAAAIEQRVCDAMGAAPLGQPCPGLTLVSSTIGAGGADARVVVTYEVRLLYGRIVGAFASGILTLRADAIYPGLAP